jgi:hypothetical protein
MNTDKREELRGNEKKGRVDAHQNYETNPTEPCNSTIKHPLLHHLADAVVKKTPGKRTQGAPWWKPMVLPALR